jgi:hypothetical protein
MSSRALFGRLLHFENRYWSVGKLMEETGIKNIMEISSGFSFRGLDKVLNEDVFYIDTDLPDLIADKKIILDELLAEKGNMKGTLFTEPLNVLDENAFLSLVSKFPEGPVCIINEGLMMYLNMEEKKQMGAIIHRVLQERGGCWITADIYIKNPDKMFDTYSQHPPEFARFLAAHHVEENKFDSFEAAKRFFDQCDLKIDQRNILAYDKLSALKFVADKIELTEDMVRQWMKVRETWKLKAAS